MLTAGDTLPDVRVLDDSGEEISLRELAGARAVLFFYPKADTPGCTSEAQQFRDLYEQFTRKGVVVVGVSRDTVEAQTKFKRKYELPFPLLADTESRVCDAFGVIVEKNMYGRKSLGIQRSTFSIENGTIVKVWPKVSVTGHAAEVLASV